ncbi:sterol 3-beta-glucosyltransferase [Saccharomycopsis crataegensis]|uniref:Sterol 3-beta-glucosyltransferase n=1 Tax=Saccharomycopsis crataegensis TaxID=43959 RepID=A0AAV5QMD6_9ASCO|nr:sterol 3-beta-glucosyltransferase [Saccharomycopsis crataegensis]
MEHKRFPSIKRGHRDFKLNKAAKSLVLSVPLARSKTLGRKRTKNDDQISPNNHPDSDDEDNSKDLGKLKMGRSVISLLTTTSMYSEFNKFNDNEYIPPNEQNVDDKEVENEDDSDEYSDAVDDKVDETSRNETLKRLSHLNLSLDPAHSSSDTKSSGSKHIQETHGASPLEISIMKSLESKRQVICGVQSSKIISSNKNINTRAAALCNKLISTFGVSESDELVDDHSCWLLRDVLLQGHLYITKEYLLFFAYLPNHFNNTNQNEALQEEKQIMSGNLSTKTSIGSKYQRYWCILKGSLFSVYNSSTDLYFPLLSIDLRYVLKVEIVETEKSTGIAHTAITKIASLTHHENNDELVRKNSTVSAASDVKGDSFLNKIRTRSDTLGSVLETKPQKIRILTENKTYMFSADNLTSATTWVSSIKTQIFALKNKDDKVTIKLPLSNLVDLEVNPIFENAENIRVKVLENSDSFALDDYFFLFFSSCAKAVESINNALELNKEHINQADDGYVNRHEKNSISDNYVPVESIREAESIVSSPLSDDEFDDDIATGTDAPNKISRTKTNLLVANKALKVLNPRNIVKNVIGQTIHNGIEMWSSNPTHYEDLNSLERGSEDPYFVSSDEERSSAAVRFRKYFALPDSEKLIATYYAYLQRNIPLYGKIYLGSNKICFRSLIPGVYTKMILPLCDVETCYKEKNFSFGYSGLVVVIKGHEELFFEFSTNDSRDDCEYLLLKQLDLFKGHTNDGKAIELLDESVKLSSSSNNLIEAEDIKKNKEKINLETGVQVPIIIKDFTFASPNMKPKRTFKITCLTIGSRGDVQPYLALCKKLIEQGHSPRIATHGEFKEVVEKHGIEFCEIAGSPTELMSFMGNHSTISVSFLKDAKSKFSKWIDELLETSWKACQGSEILIESPSAMAGIHIAEALDIPYFRAFTMPWTRTRAYPHAFIVPESKRGGSYNYFTHVMFENVFWKGISGQVNKWRQSTLGLAKTDLYQLQQNKVPFLYNISPTVFPPSVDFPDWITVTGYWFLDEKDNYTPPKELVEFIANAKRDKKKIVYIGFGSIVVSDAKELTEAIIDAVRKADVRCILNKGWSNRLDGDKELEIDLPPEVYNSGSIPHDWLFSHIDAAVHHGGSGTTGSSLRAGLPIIIKPFFGDQFFYAHRIEDMNVGVYLKKLNKESLANAIKKVTTDSRIIEKAKAIGAKIRAEKGVETAVESIYSQLDYSQRLISNKLRASKLRQSEPQSSSLVKGTENAIEDIDDLLNDKTRSPKSHHSRNSSRSSNEHSPRTRRVSNSSWLLL